MRRIFFVLLIITLSLSVYSDDTQVDKSLENSITKDYDQDGVYSSYEKALRKAQGSIYVTLPDKRGYWYTMLDRIKAEEEELLPDENKRMRKR